MKEIGSEFQNASAPIGKNAYTTLFPFSEKRMVLSGRTGLSLIANDLIQKFGIKSIALPSYCCSSMIYPFHEKGIKILFYPIPEHMENVSNEEVFEAISVIKNTDAVLIMDYFGFIREYALILSEISSELGKRIVVDSTQTAFSNPKTYFTADYILMSYRKWADILCANVYSKDIIKSDSFKMTNNTYEKTWRRAAELKEQYIGKHNNRKEEYLELYNQANCMLDNEYESFAASTEETRRFENIDTEILIKKRRENAEYIIEMVKQKNCSNIELVFNHLEKDDCPLFVPILLKEGKRNGIRRELIDNEIYCPIHWTLNKKYPYYETKYHRREISLICDQRYTIVDIKKEVELFLLLVE